ncbi:hypothetical protein HWV62_12496 [Athelia sp. TMB]|nr:hypothetical protein HWV62_12496 [Athelia sp. TMB]
MKAVIAAEIRGLAPPDPDIQSPLSANNFNLPAAHQDITAPALDVTPAHPHPLPVPPSPTPAPVNDDTSDNDNNVGTPPAKAKSRVGRRSKYTGAELVELCRAVYNINLFGAAWGEKAAHWEQVTEALWKQGMFKGTSVEVIKAKLENLLVYKWDPESKVGCSIARTLGKSNATIVAALLDAILDNKELAKERTEEQKAKASHKAAEDKQGGEALCSASMKTMQRHKCAISSDGDSDSDRENCAPSPSSPKKKACRSLAKGGDSSGDSLGQLRDIFVESDKKCDAHNQEMLAAIRESTHAYTAASEKYLEAISKLM